MKSIQKAIDKMRNIGEQKCLLLINDNKLIEELKEYKKSFFSDFLNEINSEDNKKIQNFLYDSIYNLKLTDKEIFFKLKNKQSNLIKSEQYNTLGKMPKDSNVKEYIFTVVGVAMFLSIFILIGFLVNKYNDDGKPTGIDIEKQNERDETDLYQDFYRGR